MSRSPWERQPKESARAFAGFAAYRDAPRDRRSLRMVAQESGKHVSMIARWSARHAWVERAATWDDEQDRAGRAAQIDAIREMQARHVRLAMDAQTRIAEALRDLPASALTPRDIPRWLDTAIRIERMARGEPGDVLEERKRDEATEHAAQLHDRLAHLAAELAALDGPPSAVGGGEPAHLPPRRLPA